MAQAGEEISCGRGMASPISTRQHRAHGPKLGTTESVEKPLLLRQLSWEQISGRNQLLGPFSSRHTAAGISQGKDPAVPVVPSSEGFLPMASWNFHTSSQNHRITA